MAKVVLDARRFLKALGKSSKLLDKLGAKSVMKAAHLVAREAKLTVPKGTSLLANSIQVKQTGRTRAEVYANANYGVFVELGRGPGGMPPIQSIKDWLRVKGTDDSDIPSAAYLIARSIAQKGTKARPFMRDAAVKKEPAVQKILGKGFKLAIKQAGL